MQAAVLPQPVARQLRRSVLPRVLAGLLLCLGVTGAALVLERAEAATFGADGEDVAAPIAFTAVLGGISFALIKAIGIA